MCIFLILEYRSYELLDNVRLTTWVTKLEYTNTQFPPHIPMMFFNICEDGSSFPSNKKVKPSNNVFY